MRMMNLVRVRVRVAVVSLLLLALAAPLCAATANWQRQDVDWQAGGGRRIKGVRHPKDSPLPTLAERKTEQAATAKGKIAALAAGDELLVESPPVDGFVPWIAVSVTQERGADLEFDAIVETSVTGSYPAGVDWQTEYIIGLFDTGASSHVVGYADAMRAGIYPGLLTSNYVTVSGVTGSVDALVSYPLGLFLDGLDAVALDTLSLDRSGMMGESNVAVVVGTNPGDGPDLPTAIGTPLSVYYTTLIRNDHTITLTRDGETFTAPEIRMYETDDADAPGLRMSFRWSCDPWALRPCSTSRRWISAVAAASTGTTLTTSSAAATAAAPRWITRPPVRR